MHGTLATLQLTLSEVQTSPRRARPVFAYRLPGLCPTRNLSGTPCKSRCGGTACAHLRINYGHPCLIVDNHLVHIAEALRVDEVPRGPPTKEIAEVDLLHRQKAPFFNGEFPRFSIENRRLFNRS